MRLYSKIVSAASDPELSALNGFKKPLFNYNKKLDPHLGASSRNKGFILPDFTEISDDEDIFDPQIFSSVPEYHNSNLSLADQVSEEGRKRCKEGCNYLEAGKRFIRKSRKFYRTAQKMRRNNGRYTFEGKMYIQEAIYLHKIGKLYSDYGRSNISLSRKYSREVKKYSDEVRKYSGEAGKYSSEGKNYSSEAKNYSSEAKNYSSEGRNYSSEGKNYSSEAKNYSSEGKNYSSEAKNYSSEARNYSSEGKNYSSEGRNYSSEGRNYSSEGRNYSSEARNYSSGSGKILSVIRNYLSFALNSKKSKKSISFFNPANVNELAANPDAYLYYCNNILLEINNTPNSVSFIILNVNSNGKIIGVILFTSKASRSIVLYNSFIDNVIVFDGVIERYCGVPP